MNDVFFVKSFQCWSKLVKKADKQFLRKSLSLILKAFYFFRQVSSTSIIHYNTQFLSSLQNERLFESYYIGMFNRSQNSYFVQRVRNLFFTECLQIDFLQSINFLCLKSLNFVYGAKCSLANNLKNLELFFNFGYAH